ncbi:MAG: ATP-binding protein [Candidatus Omnitrophota bacterium]
MKVQRKIILLLVLLSAIFIAGRYLYQLSENKKAELIFKEDRDEKNTYLSKIVELKGLNLQALAFDYTYWDEMVNFIRSSDLVWARKMLTDNVLDTYQADAIWVYKTDLSLLYSVAGEGDASLKEFSIPKDVLAGMFLKERFSHFFVNTTLGLLEVRGATVHPSSDPKRETTLPQGYFFTGRLWSKGYLAELANLIGGKIEVVRPEQAPPVSRGILESTMFFSREFNDWSGEPVARLNVRVESKKIEAFKSFSKNTVILFILFLASILFVVMSVLITSVNIPLAMISRALKTEDSGKLRSLENDTSEFGDISRLIARFFRQKGELVKEVQERREAEKKLQESYARLKEAQEQLIQAEKLNAVGQLASGVAHEVRNPLGIILQGVNYLEQKIPAEQRDTFETLAMIKESVGRADKIINTLLDFSKSKRLNLEPENINSILETSLNLVKTRFKSDKIAVVKEMNKDVPDVLADKNKMEQVFINILLNAFQAIEDTGRITIRTYDKKLGEIKNGIGKRASDNFRIGETAVIVEIEDTGSGIPEETLNKIFDPFFTTKGPLGGAGLGLSVSRNIIHMHRGVIYVESVSGKGTRITLVLKIARR